MVPQGNETGVMFIVFNVADILSHDNLFPWCISHAEAVGAVVQGLSKTIENLVGASLAKNTRKMYVMGGDAL